MRHASMFVSWCCVPLFAAAPVANALAAPAAEPAAQPADIVLLHGAVYTQDEKALWVEAVAVRDGRYVAVGSDADMRALAGPSTRVIDLHGRMLMPGLIDAHVHAVEGGAELLFNCNFAPSFGAEQIKTTLAQCHRKAKPGVWMRGGSWDSDFFAHQNIPSPRRWLDAIVGDRPVTLKDDAHHNTWANSAALRAAGIGPDTPDPPGGKFLREADGKQPNGIVLEAAADKLGGAAPAHTPEELWRAVLHSQELAHGFGIIGIKEADSVEPTIASYHEVEQAGKLALYVKHCISTFQQQKTPDSHLDFQVFERIRSAYRGQLMQADCVKFYLDGVPTPARTASMLDPYLPDEKGSVTHGLLHVNPAVLDADLVELDQRGFTVKMHAAGDGAVREGLDAIAAARKVHPRSDLRHEIAHASFISPQDIPRFGALNAVADESPAIWYPSSVFEAVAAAVGKERARRFWPMRALIDAHAPMSAGSDWPAVAASMNPWGAIEAMVTRADPFTNGSERLWPEQGITLAEALRIYTLGGAAALRREAETGSVEVGKSADFIVLDRNLFKVPVTAVSDVRVEMTYFQGREVYRRHEKADHSRK